ncbi:carbohydrate-binding module family 1 protein [Piromyces sp. E2]|nr:carbohydrate-binding module family 1 protein [Piromyces sp. E2]|eukprot:OUM65764.1 carbohydrate-binding module family 1 protein [Piromyces sp. E2]
MNEVPTSYPTSNIINEIPTISNENNTETTKEASTTESVIKNPSSTTTYDIRKEKDINFILEAETIEPAEVYEIPDYIPDSSKIMKKESYMPVILDETYENNAILKEDIVEEGIPTGVVEVKHDETEVIPEDIVYQNSQKEKIAYEMDSSISEVQNNDNCVPLYGQCGGQNYNGSTCCKEGKCTMMNIWYYQCV